MRAQFFLIILVLFVSGNGQASTDTVDEKGCPYVPPTKRSDAQCLRLATETVHNVEIRKIIEGARTERVKWALIHASKIERDNFNTLILGEYWHQHIDELYEGFDYLSRLERVSEIMQDMLAPIVFDFKDHLLKIAFDRSLSLSRTLIRGAVDHALMDNLNRIVSARFNFEPLYVKQTQAFSLNSAEFFPTNNMKEAPKDTLTIFHGAFEGPNAKVGGLGSFLQDFVDASILSGKGRVQPIVVTPFYDFLKSKYRDAEFIGYVDHVVETKKRSAIYRVRSNGVTQFLIQPDPQNARLFDRGKQNQIYVAREFSETDMMMMYYGSALAVMAGTYFSDEGTTVDILHLHSYQTGLAARLLKKYLNPLRTKNNLKPVKVAATSHIYTGITDGFVSEKIFEPVELEIPVQHTKMTSEYTTQWAKTRSSLKEVLRPFSEEFRDIVRGWWNSILESRFEYRIANLMKDELETVDKINVVSKSLAEDMLAGDSFFKTLGPKFTGILSGINTRLWNIADPRIYGEFATGEDFSDLEEKTKAAKLALRENGIINDENKPLFLYVGRFSKEKGIDLLPHIATEVLASGAQMIIMGPDDGPIVRDLRSLELSSNGDLRVFNDLQRDQLDFLADTSVQKGRVIRLAADFIVIPSDVEACGLVAIESFCTGGMIAASYVQGLKQLCLEKNLSSPDEMFNCVKMPRDFVSRKRDIANAKMMVQDALRLEYNLVVSGTKFEMKKKIVQTCKLFDWTAESGPISLYFKMYDQMINSGRNGSGTNTTQALLY